MPKLLYEISIKTLALKPKRHMNFSFLAYDIYSENVDENKICGEVKKRVLRFMALRKERLLTKFTLGYLLVFISTDKSSHKI
ncbi:CLUMA_CG013391, isoform A [Clunio marinus]|uniref:CLUMA_CG013391, isoform A n=1 Tax=Clunio marinus TaxID=568069 RepID=A0A1J1IM10_9DIPT|nr:CLUMA_CG013391, isoform A [Clunio marinus]